MATVTIAVPVVKRPAGISLLSGLLLCAAVALLALTLIHRVGGFAGVFQLLAVLVIGLIAALARFTPAWLQALLHS